MKIHVYDAGRHICSFDGGFLGLVMNVSAAPAQEEEFGYVMNTLSEISEGEEDITLFLDRILSEPQLSADITNALPAVFSAVGKLGCTYLLSEDTAGKLLYYSSMYTSAMEIKFRNLTALRDLGETVSAVREDMAADICTADSAAETIAAALPDRQMKFTACEDLKFLYYVLDAMEDIADSCTYPENALPIYAFIDAMSGSRAEREQGNQ